jgi:MFS family permease
MNTVATEGRPRGTLRNGYISFIFATCFYMYQYVLRVLPSVIRPEMIDKFNVTLAEFGSFSGSYYIGYAGAHIPLGILLDKFGVRIVCSISAFVAAAGILPIVYSDSWSLCVIGRVLTGVGSAGLVLSLLRIVGIFFRAKFGQMLGITASIGLVGGMFGGTPVAYCISLYGLQSVVFFVVTLGCLMGVGFWSVVRDEGKSAYVSVRNNLISLITNHSLTALCLCAGLMIASLEGFADMWGALFLSSYSGFDIQEATFLATLVFLGMGIGSPIIGVIADKFRRHNLICAICGMIIAISCASLFFHISNAYIVATMTIIMGLCSAYQIPALDKAAESVKGEAFSLATSYANMIFMSFGSIYHSLIGKVMDVSQNAGYAEDMSSAFGIAVIPLFSMVGAIGFLILYLREKKIDTVK